MCWRLGTVCAHVMRLWSCFVSSTPYFPQLLRIQPNEMTRLHPSTCLVVSIIGAWSVLSCPTGVFGWLSVPPPRKPLPVLPLGVADFEKLRTETPSYVYVDKTACLQYLVGGGTELFLARPRRFGKTLLLDTIKCMFMKNGHKKELRDRNLPTKPFKGCLCILTKES